MLTRRTSLVLAALVLSLLVAPAEALARDAFNGAWKVVVTPDEDARKAGEKEFKDVFTFKGGMFESKSCKAHGFPAVQYEEDTRKGIVATFKANAKSTKGEGAATWTGTSTAGEMQGELTWKKADGTELKYTIKGTREQ
ncbi:MAG: hypothetical protein QOF78_2598 [Phycisphaerales bacterium]|jgi:hypothetical protein|nr:hypothetical protein [Phycisphaerales bacterium]